MRKRVSLFVLISVLFAHFSYGATLDEYEQSFYGKVFSAESAENRLARLEMAVTGKVSTGTDSDRLQALDDIFTPPKVFHPQLDPSVASTPNSSMLSTQTPTKKPSIDKMALLKNIGLGVLGTAAVVAMLGSAGGGGGGNYQYQPIPMTSLPPIEPFRPIQLQPIQTSSVNVAGYWKNGAWVNPYMRSAPDGFLYNNYSTRGNINPWTGRRGYVRPY